MEKLLTLSGAQFSYFASYKQRIAATTLEISGRIRDNIWKHTCKAWNVTDSH
jgi:hypothetical protein